MKRLCFIVVCALSVCVLFGQAGSPLGQAGRVAFDFVDQELREIIYALSTWSRTSIIGDDTVTGKASFQYNGTSFEEAFDSFLLTNRLFVEKTDRVWLVSRVKIAVTRSGIILDSFDATASQLIDKLTQKTNATILRDILPSARITLHLETATPREAVELLMKPFPEYRVEANTGYIHIRKEQVDAFASMQTPSGLVDIREFSGLYDVTIERGRLADALERLFQAAGKEYVSFVRPEQTVERLRFSGKELPGALGLILEQGGGEYREIGGMFYVFPLQQADIIAGLKNEGKGWKVFETRYRHASEILPLVQARFSGLQTLSTSDTSSFLAFVSGEMEAGILEYLPIVDTPLRSEPIRLKYIKTEDLYRSLPPTVKREDLVTAGENTFFFVGSAERRAVFLKDLEVIDIPQPRIRYDLFIIQVQDGINLNWNVQADARLVRPGDRTMVMGQLGNLLNLSFDIITLFGYQFAAKLNAAISNNEASVFVDTTLFGLSGQEIKFQNTSTYRYRDSNIDPDTGKPVYSGVTREIVSGLVLDIKGWVSGDGMITTNVAASVSKRGADVSSTIGNPPPTSEKLLTTQVRGRSGEIVVLSGLRQNDSTIVEQGVPLISRIPFLGWLFKSKNNTTENTQLIIYLVPHLDLANDEYTVNGVNVNRIASVYTRFVETTGEDE